MTVQEALDIFMDIASYSTSCHDDDVEALRVAIDLFKKFVSGKLIELPCKVGDTVYHYGDSFSIREIDIYNGKILFQCGNAGTDDYMVFDNEDLGKTVFLNRKEDEKMMEELMNEISNAQH